MHSVETPALPRRLQLASISLLLSAFLFRGPAATALVTRGDSFLAAGEIERARSYYERAVRLGGANEPAIERLAFSGLMLRTPPAIRASISAASQGLALEPQDAELIADRGLLFRLARDSKAALADFIRAAVLTRDARLFHLAAWSALRSGDVPEALHLWRTALRADASFSPARRAIARYQAHA
jgi:tetratricopeptide (TPR) repeat protein